MDKIRRLLVRRLFFQIPLSVGVRKYANRMIGAAKVANVLAPTGAIPATGWITRSLTILPKEKQVEAWDRAVYTARGEGARHLQAPKRGSLCHPEATIDSEVVLGGRGVNFGRKVEVIA